MNFKIAVNLKLKHISELNNFSYSHFNCLSKIGYLTRFKLEFIRPFIQSHSQKIYYE